MGELRTMGRMGDTKVIWDRNSADEVKAAKDTFDRLTEKSYIAYSVKKRGKKGKKITEFDPAAERIILVPPLQGG